MGLCPAGCPLLISMETSSIKINYILYARKSSESEDRQVLSIDSQVDELKSLASRSGLAIAEVRTEAHSAKAPGRPIFESIVKDIETGKAQAMIVWNADRLSRNSVDTGRLIYLFDLGKLTEIITPTQVFKNTPNDKFLLNLLCSQAKLENDNKGINVKRGLKAKCERGIYPAPAPLGYLNDKYALKGNKTITKDPDRFDIVRKLFDLMLTGKYSVAKLEQIADEQFNLKTPSGGRLSDTNLYLIFNNPFYYGQFEYPKNSGNWYKGIHEPMITEDEFDRIQIILGNRSRPRPKARIFAYTGLIRCGECKSMITAEKKTKRQKNGNIHFYTYYHCTRSQNKNCAQKSVEEKELEKQIAKTLDRVEIPEDFHFWAMKWYRQANVQEAMSRKVMLSQYQKSYKACTNKVDALIDMRAGGEINEQEFREKKSKAVKDKLKLEELLADFGDRVNKWLDKADKLFKFSEEAKISFADDGIETRHDILADLGSNLCLKDKLLDVSTEKPILLMQELSHEVKLIHSSIEPREIPLSKTETERLYARNPVVVALRGIEPRFGG